MKKVCVIGAGAAGLCAAKHLLEKRWQVIIYEKSNEIGGTWNYSDDLSTDSSMYKNLRTNLPKEIMQFPGFPFPTNLPSFVSHTSVLDYLKAYSTRYNLLPYVKFNHTVMTVHPVAENKWSVSVQAPNEVSQNEIFDSIFVCNGHYSKPFIPELPGNSDFEGIQIHSHYYREPEIYKGKRVAILGAGPSGVDIGLEISEYANYVYLCHNKKPFESEFPKNFIQKSGFVGLSKDGVMFNTENSNEPALQIDTVIYCTGYEYCFDFFDYNEIGLKVSTNAVTPLYLHMVHVKYPNLFFIGLCFTIVPFPNFDLQIRYALSVLSGRSVLPSEREMLDWIDQDREFRAKNIKSKQLHYLGPRQWDYLKLLSALGGFDHRSIIPEVLERIYDYQHIFKEKHFATYKSLNVIIDGDKFSLHS